MKEAPTFLMAGSPLLGGCTPPQSKGLTERQMGTDTSGVSVLHSEMSVV